MHYYCEQGVKGLTEETGRSGATMDSTLMRAATLHRIKEFSRRNEVEAFVFDSQTESTLLNTGLSPRLMVLLRENLVEGAYTDDFGFFGPVRDRFFAKEFYFPPWNWRVVILRTEARYADVIKMVRQVNLNTMLIILGGAVLLTFFLNRVIKRPITAIVEPIRNGRAPKYK